MARRRLWVGLRPRPAGACGSTDGMISRPSSRNTSSTRSAGSRRSGRQLGGVAVTAVAVGHHVGADLGQPALCGAVGVVDACGAVGQVDGHADRRGATSARAADRRASQSVWVRLCRPRYRPAAWRPGPARRRRWPDRRCARSVGPTRWSDVAGAGCATPRRDPTPPPPAAGQWWCRAPRWFPRPSRRRSPRSRRRRRSARRGGRACARCRRA